MTRGLLQVCGESPSQKYHLANAGGLSSNTKTVSSGPGKSTCGPTWSHLHLRHPTTQVTSWSVLWQGRVPCLGGGTSGVSLPQNFRPKSNAPAKSGRLTPPVSARGPSHPPTAATLRTTEPLQERRESRPRLTAPGTDRRSSRGRSGCVGPDYRGARPPDVWGLTDRALPRG